ncbi:hypothetical protein ACIBHY_31675 [Nonomuraea sp. NPDC050547]|uniref:hypothetical protein n=1 Tax=unclassified Nonomuraea TaxID=2593643 RepID=UPI0037A05B9C
MRLRERVAAISAAMLSAGLVLSTTTPAHAVPDNCTVNTYGVWMVTSTCTTGTGEHRVSAVYINSGGHPQSATGDWAPVGGLSVAYTSGYVTYSWVAKRG